MTIYLRGQSLALTIKEVSYLKAMMLDEHFACGDCDPCLGGRPDQCAVMAHRPNAIVRSATATKTKYMNDTETHKADFAVSMTGMAKVLPQYSPVGDTRHKFLVIFPGDKQTEWFATRDEAQACADKFNNR